MSPNEPLTSRPSDRMAVVRLLDVEPELASDLSEEDFRRARERLVTPVRTIPAGRWDPPHGGANLVGFLGLLVLEGVLTRGIELGKSPSAELLGPGDILRPWQDESEVAPFPVGSHWNVLEPARVALLDARFTRAAGEWPEVVAGIYARTWQRVRRLGIQLAIAQLGRVDLRLHVFFWRIADRWGRVRPDGVLVPLRLTHEVLATIVGAQRPSVTVALKQLHEAGLVIRQRDGSWLLQGEPPDVRKILSERASQAPTELV